MSILLSNCASAACLTTGMIGDTQVTASEVGPGTYTIAVDGYKGSQGRYDLELGCTPLDIEDLVVDFNVDDDKAHDDNPGDGISHDFGGACTLRAAIEEANVLFGRQRISFASPMVINVASSEGDLPIVSSQVTVDASSVWDADAGVPGVTIDGGGVTNYGLRLSGGSSQLYGLYTTGMTGPAVSITSADNIIGGPAAGHRNVLSANGRGVWISGGGAHDNIIQSNYIGLDPTGSFVQPNQWGVLVASGATFNTIGGASRSEGNVISGNTLDGIYINQAATLETRVGREPDWHRA